MRLGVITTSYPAAPGDPAGGFVAEHVRWLRSAGHTVDVVCADRGQRDALVVRAGASLFRAAGAPEALDTGARAWPRAAAFAVATTAAVRRHRARWDAIIAHWLAPSALAAALAGGRPMVAIAHGSDVHLLCRAGLARPAAALLSRARAHVVFVSEALRQRFAAAAGAAGLSTDVCPMGIDVARFAATGGVAPRASGPPAVLFLGRLVPIKGVPVLVDAVARVPFPVRLRVAGAGPERAAIERRAAQRGIHLELLGELRGVARDRAIAAADVVVVPSVETAGRTEGMPVVALEAMATGVPVIGSHLGGLATLPQRVVTTFNVGDPADLAGSIVSLLTDPAARRAQLTAASAYAAAHDWSRVGPRLMGTFDCGPDDRKSSKNEGALECRSA